MLDKSDKNIENIQEIKWQLLKERKKINNLNDMMLYSKYMRHNNFSKKINFFNFILFHNIYRSSIY